MYTGEISIQVSVNSFYDGPAIRIAFEAAERLRRDYGIHAYVEIDNSSLTSPHMGAINYWSAAIIVNGKVVYIDDGDEIINVDGIEAVIDAVLGIVDGVEPSEKLAITDSRVNPQAYPGESIEEPITDMIIPGVTAV